MICKNCGLEKPIVNKHFGLCLECNNKRLHGSIYGKQYKHTQKKQSPLKQAKNKLKQKEKWSRIVRVIDGGRREGKSWTILFMDEAFYEQCFNNSDHKCEECGEKLPTEFRNSEEKVIMKSRYSHIIAKSIAPELRHVLKNINHLCFICHQKWDFGEKTKMKIYKGNKKLFPNYLK